MPRKKKVPTRLQLLEEQFRKASEAVSDMQQAGSYQALVAGRRQVLQIHEELVALKKAQAEEAADSMTAEEFESQLVDSLRMLPRDLAQRLMDEAHPPPGLRVVEG